MNWPLLHLTISHFPVILAIVGALAMLGALVRARRSIWLYGTVSLVLAGASVVAAYLTGPPAAHTLLGAAGAGNPMDAHQEAAKIAALLVVIAGLAAGVAWRRLVRYPRELRMPPSLRAALVATSLIAAVAAGYASWLGTRIAHAPRPATRAVVPPP